MKNKSHNIIDLILNLGIVLSTVWAIGLYYISGPDALGSVGSGCLKYFTTDSNILVALAAIVMIIFNVIRLFKPAAVIPKWASVLKYAGTSAVTLTLLTVVFFLGPTVAIRNGFSSYFLMFKGNTFALHFSTPVLAIISLVCFEKDNAFNLGDCLIACLPSYIYSFVYFTMVVCLKLWSDWYGFTFGGKLFMIPCALVAMYLATYLISAVLRRMRKV